MLAAVRVLLRSIGYFGRVLSEACGLVYAACFGGQIGSCCMVAQISKVLCRHFLEVQSLLTAVRVLLSSIYCLGCVLSEMRGLVYPAVHFS